MFQAIHTDLMFLARIAMFPLDLGLGGHDVLSRPVGRDLAMEHCEDHLPVARRTPRIKDIAVG